MRGQIHDAMRNNGIFPTRQPTFCFRNNLDSISKIEVFISHKTDERISEFGSPENEDSPDRVIFQYGFSLNGALPFNIEVDKRLVSATITAAPLPLRLIGSDR